MKKKRLNISCHLNLDYNLFAYFTKSLDYYILQSAFKQSQENSFPKTVNNLWVMDINMDERMHDKKTVQLRPDFFFISSLVNPSTVIFH